MEQLFFNEITCSFNLRCPKSNKPTNLYLVTRINGKQLKLSTGVKLYPQHWDKKNQQAYISFRLSELDNKNNLIVNRRINYLTLCFLEFKSYICCNPKMIVNATLILKEIVYKDMRTKHITATSLLYKAFSIYCEETLVKDSTKKEYNRRLNVILEFMKNKRIPDTIDSLNQSFVNHFLIYQKENHKGVSAINGTCSFLTNLINTLSRTDEYSPKIQTVSFKRLIDNRNRKYEDFKSKKSSLTDEEIYRIENLELEEEENEYRDIFLLQIYSGQRVSDIHNFFDGNYELRNEFIRLYSKKESTKSHIIYENVRTILDKYKDGLKYVRFNSSFYNKYRRHIKDIAQKANLNRIVSYYDPKDLKAQKIISKPLYEALSSHFGRHTFITNEAKNGTSAEAIALQTGHKSTKSLVTYTHLTDDDKENKLLREKTNIISAINENSLIDEDKLINEAKDVLAFLGARYEEYCDKTLDELYRLIYGTYEDKFITLLGVNQVKELYNSKSMNLIEKHNELMRLYNEVLDKQNIN